MDIFHKAIGLKSSLSEKVLAEQMALAFLGHGAKKIGGDFLASEYSVLMLSHDCEVNLAFFFRESRLFSNHLAHILEVYLLCTRSADSFTEYLTTTRYVKSPDVRILVFVPEKLPVFIDIMKLIAVSLKIVTYTSMMNGRGEEALLLNEFEYERKPAEVLSSLDTFVENAMDKTGISVADESRPSIIPEMAEAAPEAPKSSAPRNEKETYFRRAKLNREEIRALLDLNLELNKIKG